MQLISIEGIVQHFGKYSYSLFCRELDEKVELIHICLLNIKSKPGKGLLNGSRGKRSHG